ncbi:riboflavin synthase [Taibaiella sp. KBW10]|uniref:riboflavin synthase n=1 Tax=Taibaiella sp. KBW10 TaxID=2153357 RepID=UPI000F5B26BC|nr:riboflavin synthase [Taibaiella sp. KBW10]RQO31981.1 riboflavin synthase [Taibaiella sp. KBW10]
MFTGIIKHIGEVRAIEAEGSNIHYTIATELSSDLNIDQSVAHDGVCLTVVALNEGSYVVTAIEETLQKTNLKDWTIGRKVNLELALQLGTRLDGHFVQGHVDTTGVCVGKEESGGSHLFTFEFPAAFAPLMIEKGSICINGVSLTSFQVTELTFQVAIIPYTYEHTGFHDIAVGDRVNLEFDILGKYFLRKAQLDAANVSHQ